MHLVVCCVILFYTHSFLNELQPPFALIINISLSFFVTHQCPVLLHWSQVWPTAHILSVSEQIHSTIFSFLLCFVRDAPTSCVPDFAPTPAGLTFLSCLRVFPRALLQDPSINDHPDTTTSAGTAHTPDLPLQHPLPSPLLNIIIIEAVLSMPHSTHTHTHTPLNTKLITWPTRGRGVPCSPTRTCSSCLA